MEKTLPISILIIVTILVSTLWTVPCTAASGQTFKFVLNWQEASGRGGADVEACAPGGPLQRRLYDASQGRILLDIKPNLFPTNEALNAMAAGLVDISIYPNAFMSSTYPLLDYQSVPGMCKNLNEMEAVTYDPRIIKIFQEFNKSIGLQYLCTFLNPAQNAIWTTKAKLDTTDSFKGLKLRASGNTQKLAAQKLGANVVVIAASEIQNSLIRGTVDGIITTALYGRRTGLPDLCSYINIWPIGSGYPTTLAMNAKKFNSLPPDLQKVMKDVCTEIGHMETFAIGLEHMSAMTAIGASKTQIVEPSKAEYAKAVKLLAPVVDEWAKNSGPSAPKILEIASDAVSKYRAVWEK